jgi:hypothetical protein
MFPVPFTDFSFGRGYRCIVSVEKLRKVYADEI